MPFKKGGPVSYEINKDGINEIIDEQNNSILMLRQVAWNGRAEHLELRKWAVGEESEVPMKGVTFTTEEAPHNLVNVMTKLGFGDTKTILSNMKDRADFDQALVETVGMQKVVQAKNTEYEVTQEDYFDPKEMMME
jgi:hypothetical protein